VIACISLTVLSSVANNIMENVLVVIGNLQQMATVKDGDHKLTLPNVGLLVSWDVLAFGAIAALTVLKEAITLGVLGDAIDFALILQFTVFAVLSLANAGGARPRGRRSLVPMASLAANGFLGVWHLCYSSPLPMIILTILVLLPLASGPRGGASRGMRPKAE